MQDNTAMGNETCFFLLLFTIPQPDLFKNESKKWNRRKRKANVTWIRSASLFRKKGLPRNRAIQGLPVFFISISENEGDKTWIKSKLAGAKQKRKQMNTKGSQFTRQNQLLSSVPCGDSSWMVLANPLWSVHHGAVGTTDCDLLEWLFRCFPF